MNVQPFFAERLFPRGGTTSIDERFLRASISTDVRANRAQFTVTTPRAIITRPGDEVASEPPAVPVLTVMLKLAVAVRSTYSAPMNARINPRNTISRQKT